MCRMMPGRPTASTRSEVPLPRNQAPMPPQQGVRRDDGVELKQGLSAYSSSLPRQEGTLGVGEADAPSSEPVLEQSVLGLQEFDDDQLMTMNPASGDHQQKRQERWYRAHPVTLPSRRRSYFWTARRRRITRRADAKAECRHEREHWSVDREDAPRCVSIRVPARFRVDASTMRHYGATLRITCPPLSPCYVLDVSLDCAKSRGLR